MCGIAGIVYNKETPVEPAILSKMTEVLHHRGPDASGFFIKKNVGLGHKRLSVIDTSVAANQPMFNEDGSVVVVFNGEIYNFSELTDLLSQKGHSFATRSDTEVIIHAWEEFGPDCVSHFRGMFAFAIYDIKKQLLYIARDCLGKKPLFYFYNKQMFIFGSEIKSLITIPDLKREIDVIALGEYAAYGYMLGEHTIFDNIRKLQPGHYLTIDLRLKGLTPHVQQYWKLKIAPDHKPSEQDWLDEMDMVLSEAVRIRMRSDVPLGAFLSGGIDSSLITAYMAKHNNNCIKTFTIGFNEPAYDESCWAATVSKHLGTEHYFEIVTPKAADILQDLVHTFDEPFGDSSIIPTFLLCRLTGKQVTVALSGDGGDEMFLGYSRYPMLNKTYQASRRITGIGRCFSKLISRVLPYGKWGKRSLERLSMKEFDQYNHAMGYSVENLSLLRTDILKTLPIAIKSKVVTDFYEQSGLALIERYQYADIMNYLPDDILVKVDRASMRHSLEVRCPLLDQKVVELAAKIPHQMKLSGFNGKIILKKLAQRYIPEKVLERPKMGFGVPLSQWFKGELAGLLKDMLFDRGNPMWDYYDRKRVANRVHTHLTRNVDSSAVLWRVLYFYLWCDVYLK